MKRLYRIPMMAFGVALMISACSKDEDDNPANVFVPTPGCFDQTNYTSQLPNLNFESWGSSNESNGKYEEPCGGIWATGNPGTALFNESVVTKTTDAQNGTYAARLETKNVFNLLSSGAMFTGTFTVNFNDPAESANLGVPFTNKPLGFEGYYKYTSVNGDSSQIYTLLTKYNTATNGRDTVGYGQFSAYTTNTTYTKFNYSISYNFTMGTATPDTMIMVFVSSKAGLDFKGEVGSTLFVDNCQFTY